MQCTSERDVLMAVLGAAAGKARAASTKDNKEAAPPAKKVMLEDAINSETLPTQCVDYLGFAPKVNPFHSSILSPVTQPPYAPESCQMRKNCTNI